MLRLAVAILGSILAVTLPAASADLPLTVPAGFQIVQIARVAAARELAVAPNGDLFVGTQGNDVYVIPHPDGTPGSPHVFVSVPERPAPG